MSHYLDSPIEFLKGVGPHRADVLKKDPVLKEKLEAKKAADPKFAANSSEILDFIYKNSTYYEKAHLRYPVYRIDN